MRQTIRKAARNSAETAFVGMMNSTRVWQEPYTPVESVDELLYTPLQQQLAGEAVRSERGSATVEFPCKTAVAVGLGLTVFGGVMNEISPDAANRMTMATGIGGMVLGAAMFGVVKLMNR